jgi:hypothetical protein
MKVRVTFTQGLLGTASANPDVHEEFIASRSADKEKMKEELEALHVEELMEKAMTIFPRTADGVPMLWDYQVKGFLKEALGILLDFVEPDAKIGKAKLSRWTFRKIVDNAVMVSPRQIVLRMPDDSKITKCTRPIRMDTPKGERVALVTSEEVPKGTVCEFEIAVLHNDLLPFIGKCLDYGAQKGFGQWRNSGKGRFTWMEVSL